MTHAYHTWETGSIPLFSHNFYDQLEARFKPTLYVSS